MLRVGKSPLFSTPQLIRQWGHKKFQMGLTRSIINVPTNMNNIQAILSRSINGKIANVVARKGRIQYKNPYEVGIFHRNHYNSYVKDNYIK